MSRRDRNSDAPLSLFSFQDIITSLSGILILLVLILAVKVSIEAVEGSVQTALGAYSGKNIEELVRTRDDLKKEMEYVRSLTGGYSGTSSLEEAKKNIELENKLFIVLDGIETLSNQYKSAIRNIGEIESAIVLLTRQLAEKQAQLSNTTASAASSASTLRLIPDKNETKKSVVVECAEHRIRMGQLDSGMPPVEFPNTAEGRTAFEQAIEAISPSLHYFVFLIRPSGVPAWQRFRPAVEYKYDYGYDALEDGVELIFGSGGS